MEGLRSRFCCATRTIALRVSSVALFRCLRVISGNAWKAAFASFRPLTYPPIAAASFGLAIVFGLVLVRFRGWLVDDVALFLFLGAHRKKPQPMRELAAVHVRQAPRDAGPVQLQRELVDHPFPAVSSEPCPNSSASSSLMPESSSARL